MTQASEANSAAAVKDVQLKFAAPWRRVGAIVYDTLLVIAVLFVATLPFLPLLHGRVMTQKEVGGLVYLYWSWQVFVVAMFFVIFWTRRGQSLGMQAWRLRIETQDGQLPSVRHVLQRLAWACVPWLPAFFLLNIAEQSSLQGSLLKPILSKLGVGLLGLVVLNYGFAWLDPMRRAWHDRWLQTRILHRPN